MDVARHNSTSLMKYFESTRFELLAKPPGLRADFFRNRCAARKLREQKFLVRIWIGGKGGIGNGLRELHEGVIPRDEIRLGINFSENAVLLIFGNASNDNAFLRNAIGALGGRGRTAFAKHFDGLLLVAIGLFKRLL